MKCPDNTFSQFDKTSDKDNEDKYICTDACKAPKPYYYRTDLKCIKKCKEEDYLIENTNECSPICETINSIEYHYYKKDDKRKCVLDCSNTDKQILREDNEYYDKCDENSYNYFAENKVCLSKCPNGYKVNIKNEKRKSRKFLNVYKIVIVTVLKI